jgi:hypothetical protein
MEQARTKAPKAERDKTKYGRRLVKTAYLILEQPDGI